jgi:Flp pilus assembly protein TadD
MSDPLEMSDVHALRAVSGWIDLGNLVEAERELGQIPVQRRHHPDVLETEWLLTAARRDWNRSLTIAELLVAIAPGRPGAWIHRAFALRRADGGGLTRAREVLLEACDRFPDEAVIPYNLACYAAQLGELDDARRWLETARQRGGSALIQEMALADSDLLPLRDEIRKWKTKTKNR